MTQVYFVTHSEHSFFTPNCSDENQQLETVIESLAEDSFFYSGIFAVLKLVDDDTKDAVLSSLVDTLTLGGRTSLPDAEHIDDILTYLCQDQGFEIQ